MDLSDSSESDKDKLQIGIARWRGDDFKVDAVAARLFWRKAAAGRRRAASRRTARMRAGRRPRNDDSAKFLRDGCYAQNARGAEDVFAHFGLHLPAKAKFEWANPNRLDLLHLDLAHDPPHA
jgi:hypothetical protein